LAYILNRFKEITLRLADTEKKINLSPKTDIQIGSIDLPALKPNSAKYNSDWK
jgi:hypothetical protein